MNWRSLTWCIQYTNDHDSGIGHAVQRYARQGNKSLLRRCWESCFCRCIGLATSFGCLKLQFPSLLQSNTRRESAPMLGAHWCGDERNHFIKELYSVYPLIVMIGLWLMSLGWHHNLPHQGWTQCNYRVFQDRFKFAGDLLYVYAILFIPWQPLACEKAHGVRQNDDDDFILRGRMSRLHLAENAVWAENMKCTIIWLAPSQIVLFPDLRSERCCNHCSQTVLAYKKPWQVDQRLCAKGFVQHALHAPTLV